MTAAIINNSTCRISMAVNKIVAFPINVCLHLRTVICVFFYSLVEQRLYIDQDSIYFPAINYDRPE